MTTYAVIDSATGELVREYPTATDDRIGEVLTSAADTYIGWGRSSTLGERIELIRQVAKFHTEREMSSQRASTARWERACNEPSSRQPTPLPRA